MITITTATTADIPLIQEIAHKTWPNTYGEILSTAQIDYILELFYATDVLVHNMTENGHHFLLAKEDTICLGFASYEHHYLSQNKTRLHKIYMLPEAQGKGVGKLLLDEIESSAKRNKSNALSLNVNKFNKVFAFYQKMGFEIVAEENIAIGNGYLMEDYKMEKKI